MAKARARGILVSPHRGQNRRGDLDQKNKSDMKKRACDIVSIEHFVNAARDSGYKDVSTALAELIDNSFQAKAKTVRIIIERSFSGEVTVVTSDNGSGMKPTVLQTALQFGGSSRFNSRAGTGRFGMGLPNSSLSQAKRVEVISWTTKNSVWRSYLDVDEIVLGKLQSISAPQRASSKFANTKSGTLVIWTQCDRITYRDEDAFLAGIRKSLGQIFRKQIYAGKRIIVNHNKVIPIDPLFLDGRFNDFAQPFGPQLEYKIAIPNSERRFSFVRVQFVTLPIEKWHILSNGQKRKMEISKRAGVSIVRAGREIDYGWFFMGRKRKENYDDWWRCEICFEPDLDELFGVANTKQGIRPTEFLTNILTPDMEQIAHKLNGKIRSKYSSIKAAVERSNGERIAARRDYLLEPPQNSSSDGSDSFPSNLNLMRSATIKNSSLIRGLNYRFEAQKISDKSFFVPFLIKKEIILLLNKNHPFYECIYEPTVRLSSHNKKLIRQILELMLLAAGRAECTISSADDHRIIKRMREEWGRVLATFLE